MLKTLLTEKAYITERGQREFNALFGVREKLFQSPKSPHLIGDLIRTCTADGDMVLDFFAGSGTTAHAVSLANSADAGIRRFVLVQLPESCSPESAAARNGYRTIVELCKERVRRLLKPEGGDTIEGRSTNGFRVFTLAESNFTTWDAAVPHDTAAVERQMEMHVDHVREGRTDEDIVYELLLKSGFPLTTPVEKKTLADKTVYSVADGAMLVCVDRDLTLEVIRAIAAEEPQRVILLDEGFLGNDQLKANAVQTFKTKGVVKFQTV
ncbi:MAG: site-specific DNA-methyltransferase [Planctomycetes bacterium]|nr:site-specific DNA-methyltransferase [Planctomycetota bacterium]